MSFDGSEGFVGLDEEMVGKNKPLSTFVDNAIRSNVIAIRQMGHQISWAPRSYDADDHNQVLRIRPYASVALSSILSVPWIVQNGDDQYRFAFHHRVEDEHGEGEGCFLRFSLVDLVSSEFAAPNTGASTPEWQIDERVLSLPEPFRGERFTDLRIEQRGKENYTTILQSVVAHEIKRGGGMITASGAANELLRHNGSNYPDSDDKHVQVFQNQAGSDQIYDILWTSPDENLGVVRPKEHGGNYDTPTDTARTLPLAYVQVRGIEIHQIFEGETDLRARERYQPQKIVDARDEIAHPLSIDRTYRRKRCLWIGPTGTLGDTELGWYSGYGPRFARVDGNTSSAQILFPASIVPKTKAPKILVLLNILATYEPSTEGGIVFNTSTAEALEAAVGEATWTFTASVTRFGNGSSTPASVTSGEVEVELAHWPHLLTPFRAALQTEHIYRQQQNGVIDVWPYKEGQLFEEDHQLIQRVALSFDLPSHDPSINLAPYAVTLTALTEALGDFPLGETVTASDLVLAVTGCTIWEVPQ